MPTPTGKPKTGERILFDFVILGRRDATYRATVLSWPRYDRVKVKIDEVLFDPKGYFKVGDIATYDEYAAAMYLNNGTVKVIEMK